MYEMFKAGSDVIFYAVAEVVIISAVIRIMKSKKDKKDEK